MKRLILSLINVYQRTLSPDHGWFSRLHPYGHCRFFPTCSEYGRQAVERQGVIKGIGLMLWRVLKCNPYHRGGFDPVK